VKAVILAAGKGTRMRGLCSVLPKPMIPLANRPMVSVIFSRLKAMGVDDVALVIGYKGDRVREAIGDGGAFGVHVTYVRQEEQLGTGHATLLCEDFVAGDPFVLIFGDILTPEANYVEMRRLFESPDCDAVLSVFPVEDPSNGAAVDVEDGRVVGIVEKPEPGTVLNAYNNAGVFIWPADVLDLIRDLGPSERGEIEFTDGILRFLRLGKQLRAFELRGYWENLSDPEACIRMNRNLLYEVLPPDPGEARRPPDADGPLVTRCAVQSGVAIGTHCRLEDSRLEDDCRIGDGVVAHYAEVGRGAVVGDGCRLGPYVSVAEGAVIEPGSALGTNVSVGPGCVVGADSSLASAILLDGAQVGRGNSLVHVMLDVGAETEPGSKITGTPDRAVEILRS